MQESIWDLAIQQQRSKLKNGNVSGIQGLERSLLLVGSKDVGKTSLINFAVERQDQVKSTLALEYNYARRMTPQSLERDVCHVWELGGGIVFNSLLGTPLSPSKLLNLHIILMVDLSKLDELWYTLESTTNAIIAHIDNALKSPEAIELNLREKLQTQMENRMNEGPHFGSLEQEQVVVDHPDKSFIRPLLVPFVILGGKYDIFKNLDLDKKLVCKTMRFFAHYYGATLMFYSSKDSGLQKKAKELFNHHGFGAEPVKGISQDSNRPLLIPARSDSLEAITGVALNHNDNLPANDKWKLEYWKFAFTSTFSQSVNELSAVPEDPVRDPSYSEPQIDNLRSQKDDDLARYKMDIDKRFSQLGEDFEHSMAF